MINTNITSVKKEKSRSTSRSASRNTTRFMLFGFLALLFAPIMAHAGAIPSLPGTTTSSSDYSIKMIDMVLGDNWYSFLSGSSTTGAGSALSAMLMRYNTMLLTVVTMLIVYTYAIGIADTAHKGKAMGEKYSTLWTPLRQAGAITALAPIPSLGGISIMQALVAWLVAMSVSLANGVWDVGITYMSNHSGAISAPQPAQLPKTTLDGMASIAARVASLEGQGYTNSKTATLVCTSGGGNSLTDACSSPALIKGTSIISPGALGAISSTCAGSDCAAMGGAINAAWSYVLNSAVSIQNAITAGTTPSSAGLTSLVSNAQSAYRVPASAALVSALSSEGTAFKTKFASTLLAGKNNGWAAAGAFFYALSSDNSKVAAMSKATTSYGAPPAGSSGYSDVSNSAQSIQNILDRYIATDVGQNSLGATLSSTSTTSNFMSPVDRWISSHVGYPLLDHMLTAFSLNGTGDPIITLQTDGDYLIGADEAMLVAYAGARAAIAAAGKASTSPSLWNILDPAAPAITGTAGFLLSLTKTAADIILPVFYLMLGAGIILAYYLPMAPAILYSLAVIGWIILVLEAFIAAPLWAAAHAMPTGDGLTGDHGRHGYPFMMDLLMRPVLLVFALFLTLGLMSAAVEFMMVMIKAAFVSAQSTSMVGPIGAIIGFLIIAVVTYTTVNMVVNIITTMPSTVMRWFGGGHGANTGEEKHSTNIAGVVSGRSGSPMSGEAGKSLGALKSAKKQDALNAEKNKPAEPTK
jgi:conjugal transfer/type IV secretion protein DotA/TraY